MKYLLVVPMFILSLLLPGEASADCPWCGTVTTYSYRYSAPAVRYYAAPRVYVAAPPVVVQSSPVPDTTMLAPAPVQVYAEPAAPVFATVEVPVGVSYFKSETKTYRNGRVKTKTYFRY